jgi:hypothetical protein
MADRRWSSMVSPVEQKGHPMDPRFVTRKMHAWLDYPVALSLIGLPFLLHLGSSNPLALWLAVTTGVAASC